MRECNRLQYGISDSVRIPESPETGSHYGAEAMAFLRDCCEDLKFDTQNPERRELLDSDGRSSGLSQIPYNMERDLDRLSFEMAVGRFLESGAKEDAFDVYYSYCSIFKPFGDDYASAGRLIELLSEHEANASSLMMKHRDHYSHSVYVFLLGLVIYKDQPAFRTAYNRKYALREGKEAACHFLEYWGLTALFHDVGYPFEIAHQQMKAYVCSIDSSNNDKDGYAPYVSYRNMDVFTASGIGDLNDLYARAVTESMQDYCSRTGAGSDTLEESLRKNLKDRAVHENPDEKEYIHMDHGYFSGLMMAKAYLHSHPLTDRYEQLQGPVLDALCAILLHNTLFRFNVRAFLHTKEPMSIADGQPLSYLLMLCDELQTWDRTSYGQNSRTDIFPSGFDMEIGMDGMHWIYYFDRTYEEKATVSKSYREMISAGYAEKSGKLRENRSKFADEIDEIIQLKDVAQNYTPDRKLPDPGGIIAVRMEEKRKRTGMSLSDSTYMNLYDFALALNGRYAGVTAPEDMKKAFEEKLSLEYRLSNIAQARGFAIQLASIGCFFTRRPVDYEPVTDFKTLIQVPGHESDMKKIAFAEHDRWCSEKCAMGWDYGTAHVGARIMDDGTRKNDTVMRERLRLHDNLTDYEALDYETRFKDFAPMEKMLELVHAYEGLNIYRMY